jgi:hypothetical protein
MQNDEWEMAGEGGGVKGWSRGQEVKRSRGQEVKRSRGQEVKRSRGQEVKRSSWGESGNLDPLDGAAA